MLAIQCVYTDVPTSLHRSLNDISEAHWSLFGYCPQEDALDDLLTVEEHMYYYARLHGIPEGDIKGVSNKGLGLQHFCDLEPLSESFSR